MAATGLNPMRASEDEMEISEVILNGVAFHVPAPFLNPKPAVAKIDLDDNLLSGPQFTFAMPDKAPVDQDLQTHPTLKGTDGKPLVQFRIAWPGGSGVRDAAAARPFVVADAELKETGSLSMQGLESIEHSLDGPISGTKNYAVYGAIDSIRVMFRCFLKSGSADLPNPICQGSAWRLEDDVILSLRFPAELGQQGQKAHWIAPVKAAFALVTDWQMKGQKEQ